jgi:hypothetical protein
MQVCIVDQDDWSLNESHGSVFAVHNDLTLHEKQNSKQTGLTVW